MGDSAAWSDVTAAPPGAVNLYRLPAITTFPSAVTLVILSLPDLAPEEWTFLPSRLLGFIRGKSPWRLILAQASRPPEEVVATTGGSVPAGVELTWDMFSTPVFRRGRIGCGCTYWPDGPHAQPKRNAAPMWNRAVGVENEMMYQRAEENGPLDRRKSEGLAVNSLISVDPAVQGGWQIETDGPVVQSMPAEEASLLVHWAADIFLDHAERETAMDHSDDLAPDQVFDVMIADLRGRSIELEMPTEPLHDPRFIELLSSAYDPGTPRFHPAEAPGPQTMAA